MDPFQFGDEFGPRQIIYLCEPAQSLRAVVVIDNVALGHALGPVSFASDVALAPLVQGARHGTLMHAGARVPHGGAAAMILASPELDRHRKRTLLRCLASALRERRDFIACPGPGTDEECMAWMLDEGLQVAGRPAELGGSALGVSEAVGIGLAAAVVEAAAYGEIHLRGARVALSAFDAPARHAARRLADAGAAIVGVAPDGHAIYQPDGINVYELASEMEAGHLALARGKPLSSEAFVGIDCDIWLEAAADGLTPGQADAIRARLVVEGHRLGLSHETELALQRREIPCVPALVAAAGAAIAHGLELRGPPSPSLADMIRQPIEENTRAVLAGAARQRRLPRDVARAQALQRLEKGAAARRWSVFAGLGAPGVELRDPRANYEP